MDEVTYQMIRNMLVDAEKASVERHNNLTTEIRTIREQQVRSEDDRKEINRRIQILINSNAIHYKECPISQQVKDVLKVVEEHKKEVDSILLDSKFYTKNPNVFWQTVALRGLILLGTITGILFTIQQFKIQNTKEKVETVEKVTEEVVKKTDVLFEKEVNSINKPILSKDQKPLPIKYPELKTKAKADTNIKTNETK